VLRHLEVKWQLFNEALSKFGDLDAMLAVCAGTSRFFHFSPHACMHAYIYLCFLLHNSSSSDVMSFPNLLIEDAFMTMSSSSSSLLLQFAA
jgi:hypothetical protein